MRTGRPQKNIQKKFQLRFLGAEVKFSKSVNFPINFRFWTLSQFWPDLLTPSEKKYQSFWKSLHLQKTGGLTLPKWWLGRFWVKKTCFFEVSGSLRLCRCSRHPWHTPIVNTITRDDFPWKNLDPSVFSYKNHRKQLGGVVCKLVTLRVPLAPKSRFRTFGARRTT